MFSQSSVPEQLEEEPAKSGYLENSFENGGCFFLFILNFILDLKVTAMVQWLGQGSVTLRDLGFIHIGGIDKGQPKLLQRTINIPALQVGTSDRWMRIINRCSRLCYNWVLKQDNLHFLVVGDVRFFCRVLCSTAANGAFYGRFKKRSKAALPRSQLTLLWVSISTLSFAVM